MNENTGDGVMRRHCAHAACFDLDTRCCRRRRRRRLLACMLLERNVLINNNPNKCDFSTIFINYNSV